MENLSGKNVQLWEIQLDIPACIALLDTAGVGGSVKVWSAELKQSFLKTLGNRCSVAGHCLSCNIIWIKLPHMVMVSSGKYGVAHCHSLLEDGILGLMLCQSAVSSAKCELCNFKSC